MKNKLLRIIISPFGFIIALIRNANSCSRDIMNRLSYPEAKIMSGVCMTNDTIIGKKTSVDSRCIINHCNIGKYTMVHMDSRLENVTIGNYCSIAHNVMIGLGEHPIDGFSTSSFFYDSKVNILKDGFERYKPIFIGHDVWIGAGVIVLNGIKIGNGAIVAAGSVVTKDIPEYAIVAGVPAKILRYRDISKFTSLVEQKWWDLDVTDVDKLHDKSIDKIPLSI